MLFRSVSKTSALQHTHTHFFTVLDRSNLSHKGSPTHFPHPHTHTHTHTHPPLSGNSVAPVTAVGQSLAAACVCLSFQWPVSWSGCSGGRSTVRPCERVSHPFHSQPGLFADPSKASRESFIPLSVEHKTTTHNMVQIHHLCDCARSASEDCPPSVILKGNSTNSFKFLHN